MSYRERPTAVPGAVLWEGVVEAGSECARILPDGCIDLLWDEHRLFIAGPDSTAHIHRQRAGTTYVALRLSRGLGPALLGVPADDLRDHQPGLEDVWPARDVRRLEEQVAGDPAAALEQWAARHGSSPPVDPIAGAVLTLAEAATPIAAMADRLGLSPRHLHRRCLRMIGYGPRHLARVLRLGRALQTARAGAPLVQVAADCGFADQPHLCRETVELTGTTPAALLGELGLR